MRTARSASLPGRPSGWGLRGQRSGERLVDLVVHLRREVEVRPGRVAAGCGPANLLAGDDLDAASERQALAQVAVDREVAGAVLNDDVVVELRSRRPELPVVEAVLRGDDLTVEHGEHRHADVHLAEAADVGVLARMAVVRMRAARVVAHTGTRVEVDVVVEIEGPSRGCLPAGRTAGWREDPLPAAPPAVKTVASRARAARRILKC